jgi:N-acetylmuramoyl-L-alanine amidase
MSRRKIKRVILHCTDTPDSGDRFGVDDIDAWHRARGMQQVGYHWVVRRPGVIEKGRNESLQGAHCKGHNADSIGICYLGKKYPTTEQIRSLLFLYQTLKKRYQISFENWFGHNEFNESKMCPGININLFRVLLSQFDQGLFCLDDNEEINEFLEASAYSLGKSWK